MSGAPNDAKFLLDASIRCEQNPGSRITVTPTYFSMPRSWDTVNASNDVFSMTIDGAESKFALQRGSGYNVSNFRTQLQAVIRTVVPEFSVTYSKIRNKYAFAPPQDGHSYRLYFPAEQTARFLGFDPRRIRTRAFTGADPLESERGVSLAPQVSVVLHTDLMTGGVMDNFSHRHICHTGILLVVPIDVPPYDELVYRAPTPDTGTLTLHATHIHSARIRIGDESGAAIDCDDYVLGLRFDVYAGTPT
jgi:hypothetical protein